MKDGRFYLSLVDALHADRQSFLALAETYRHARRASHIQRYRCPLQISRVHGPSIDDEFLHAELVRRLKAGQKRLKALWRNSAFSG